MSQEGSFQGPDYRDCHLRDQASSGLSIAEYCRRQDLCPATFYNWRRALAGSWRERPGGGVASFTEIGRVGALATQWAAEVALVSGTVVRVGAGADAQLLRALLEVLG
jgi:hypothetical protein